MEIHVAKLFRMTLPVVALLLFAVGCWVEPDPTPTDDDDDDDDAVEVIEIPDPGEDIAPDRWYDDGEDHEIPQNAQVMGVVIATPQYIQGVIDATTQNRYYVFKTGPEQTEFQVRLAERNGEIEWVHIHDGTDLVFGALVEPSDEWSPTQVNWELDTDTVYVLEVHTVDGGGFF